MKRMYVKLFGVMLLMWLSACSNNSAPNDDILPEAHSTGQIYLYGEEHAKEKIINHEFILWHDYYHNDGFRHLFIEMPYYTAEFLNLWMQADNDEILDEVYRDLSGTSGQSSYYKEFYKQIKKQCPETIFHGTDIGHQSNTTGKRFIKYLQNNDLENSVQYILALEAIEQGEEFYTQSDAIFRENKMTTNFIRAFDKLSNQSVMGIYGNAHTGLDAMNFSGEVACMGKQLKEIYGDAVHSEDLSLITKDIAPIRIDKMTIANKEYEATYYGKHPLNLNGYVSREFWRLENAYDDFIDKPKTNNVLPYNNYIMRVDVGQIYIIDYLKSDGTVERQYHRTTGRVWQSDLVSEEFKVE